MESAPGPEHRDRQFDDIATVHDLADLVGQVVAEPWPVTEAERDHLLRRLRLRPRQPPRSEIRDGQRHLVALLETPLPEVTGLALTIEEHFHLSFFACSEPGDAGPRAREALPALRQSLTVRLGEPSEAWGSAAEPACCWSVAALSLELYCFQRLSSGLMVGIGPAEDAPGPNARGRGPGEAGPGRDN